MITLPTKKQVSQSLSQFSLNVDEIEVFLNKYISGNEHLHDKRQLPVEDFSDIQTWLLVFPHHGGKPGAGNVREFTNTLCTKVQPKIVVFSIRENIKDFPNMDVIESVEQALAEVSMLTTRSSEVFADFIKESNNELHKDCVGNIALDLERFPPGVIFSA